MFRHLAEYAGYQFIWFFGVVEDRLDPLHLGRVRVRCHGWHTDNKTDVPTEKLPWAQVLMPPTSASVSGMGETPIGLLTGSFVFGFFLDGEKAQQPMILGSLHGLPQETAEIGATTKKGFYDPSGTFPTTKDEPDTNKLARPEFRKHPITKYKDKVRTKNVPTAIRYKTESVTPSKAEYFYESTLWSEPPQRGSQTRPSEYPKNHVIQSEAGHVMEMDATPGQRRFHQYHPRGTFTEIQDDGTEIKKIVGSSYEIVAQDKNVLISGTCNITIAGDAKLLVQGDLVEEVHGNYHLTVQKDRVTKIFGNDVREVVSNENTQINGTSGLRVSGDLTTTTASNYTLFVGQNFTNNNGKNFTIHTGANTYFTVSKNQTSITLGVTYAATGQVRIP